MISAALALIGGAWVGKTIGNIVWSAVEINQVRRSSND